MPSAKVIETKTISRDCCIEADTGRSRTGITADRGRVMLEVFSDDKKSAKVVMTPRAAITVATELLACAALTCVYGSGHARDLLLKIGFAEERA